jgi:hypothetical protein
VHHFVFIPYNFDPASVVGTYITTLSVFNTSFLSFTPAALIGSSFLCTAAVLSCFAFSFF